jgi:hypothetical protein
MRKFLIDSKLLLMVATYLNDININGGYINAY